MPAQPVLDSLNTLDADATASAAAVTTKAQTATALAGAQHDDDQAAAGVTSAQTKQAADLQAFVALVQQTYRPESVTVTPAAPTVPVTPAA